MSGGSIRCGWFLGIAVGGVWTFSINCAVAQITPDGTLPTNIQLNGSIFNITGGTQAGGNLFHSFREFSVPMGGEAFFNNAVDIQNIISRVTGGSISNIDGLIRANGTANFFLINPGGIVFGQNARLDVGGSFLASTANSLRFADGIEFSATTPQTTPLLTISVPTGLQFGANPGNIILQGLGHNLSYSNIGSTIRTDSPGLQVQSGKTLALVGGDVVLEGGNLRAESGRIELGSVASPSLVSISSTESGFTLGYSDVQNFRDIQLTTRASVDTSGEGGGSIQVQSQRLAVSDGSAILSITQGSRSGGDFTVNASELVELIGESLDGQYASSLNLETQGTGSTGDLNIATKKLIATDGAYVQNYTFAGGNAGFLTIQASDSIELIGIGFFRSGFYTEATSSGNAGNLTVITGRLSLQNGAVVTASTFGKGNAGRIEIKARDTVSLSGEGRSSIANDVGFGGVGDSGGISINTGSLFLSDNALITSNVNGRGNSGGIEIVARNLVSLDNSGELALGGQPGTLILSRVNDRAVGNGGDINITTGSLRLSNSQIATSTSGQGNSGSVIIDARDQVVFLRGSEIFTEVTCPCETESGVGGDGNGGDIRIRTGSLFLDGGSNLRADTESRGNAGNIIIEARDSITFSGSSEQFTSGAFTQVEPEAVGQGGDIIITTGTLSLSGDQEINTRTQGQGDAGNIFITADSISLAGSDVRIISGASQQGRLTGTSGNGGDINITAGSLLITDEARVSANTEITGSAGDITINTSQVTLDNQGTIQSESVADADGGNITLNIRDFLLMRNTSQISTTAGTAQQGGDGGNITINTPNGFIVAVDNENSDITANAFTGRGGRVDITTSGIFGIQPRLRETPFSDITASSEFGVSGDLIINTSPVDFGLGLVELPESIADASDVIDTGCTAFADGEGSEFTITGRGGLPPSPDEPLTNDIIWTDTRIPTITSVQPETAVKPSSKNHAVEVVPATGWVFNNKGEVTLISHAFNANRLRSASATCPK